MSSLSYPAQDLCIRFLKDREEIWQRPNELSRPNRSMRNTATTNAALRNGN